MPLAGAAAVLLLVAVQHPFALAAVDHVARIRQLVDGAEIVAQLQTLAQMSADPAPAVTRVVYSPEDVEARTYIKSLMREAGLTVREDEMGNVFGKLAGETAETILSGSHCDAIPKSGMYDGTVGVLGAIMAARTIKASGVKLKRSIEAVMFTSEEPTRFGISCVGSRAMAAKLSAAALSELRDAEGLGFLQAAAAAGYAASQSADGVLKSAWDSIADVTGFVELHIEQGPLLEAEGKSVGVVQAIAAPAALSIQFIGGGGHAGGQLMHSRNDASLAAAQLALALEAKVKSLRAEDAVGTVGKWLILPNAVNSVPKEAHLEIDIRDIQLQRRDHVVDFVFGEAEAIAKQREVRVRMEVLSRDPPATCAQHVQDALSQSAAAVVGSQRVKQMVSHAYHDALFMAHRVPTGMLFIPCAKGWSHRPDEFASEADIATGVRVLAGALMQLAGVAEEGVSAREDL